MLNKEQDIRPDKILEIRLLLLVIMLTATIVGILLLFAYPANWRLIISFVLICIILSLIIAISVLQSGETAILYGGLANEILKSRKICYVIMDTDKKTILKNETARKTIDKENIVDFIKQHIFTQYNV